MFLEHVGTRLWFQIEESGCKIGIQDASKYAMGIVNPDLDCLAARFEIQSSFQIKTKQKQAARLRIWPQTIALQAEMAASIITADPSSFLPH